MARYPFWSTNTNDIENTDKACKVDNRQAIAQALQKDMPVKTNDNRLFIDNIERYAHDRQAITVATIQLLTGFPNHIPCLSLGLSQDNDSNNRDYDGEELYQVDGTTDIYTPDNSDQSEDFDSEVVIASKDRRNSNYGPDMKRK